MLGARFAFRATTMTHVRSLALVASLLVLAIAASAVRLRARETVAAATTHEDVYYLPPPGWLSPMSLGYREALADLVWMRALVYFGEETVARSPARHVFEYAEAMLALDPDFRAVYPWVGVAALYRQAQITPDDVRRTVEIMERGLARDPEDGRLAWEIGSTLAFELPPLLTTDEERDAARLEASPYLMRAARLGAAPEWLALSNAATLTRLGRAESAIAHLADLYAITSDDRTRAEIAAAIEQIRGDTYAQGMVEAARHEEEQRLRDLPYVAPDLYFLLGPRADETDWVDTYRNGFAHEVLGPADAE